MRHFISTALFITVLLPFSLFAENVSEMHKDWKLICETQETQKTQASSFCRIQQLVTDNSNDSPILMIAVGYLYNNETPTAIFTLPLGVSLKTGTALKVDNSEPVSLAYDVCDQIGCRVSLQLDKTWLEQFKSGSQAILKFSANPQRKIVGVPISLSGFTAALKALHSHK